MFLIKVELQKVWKRPFFLQCVVGICLLNILALWVTTPASVQNGMRPNHMLDRDLSGMNMQQKVAFIEEQTDLMDALHWIEETKKTEIYDFQQYQATGEKSNYADYYYSNRPEVFSKYQTMYDSQKYTLYTENITDEVAFINEIKNEIHLVNNYKQYVSGLQSKADKLKMVSIFSNPNSYEQKVAVASAQAFSNMSETKINYSAQKGIIVALDFVFSDVLLIFIMLVLASVLIRDEKCNNLLSLIRNTPKGRVQTAIAKIVAMALSLFIVVVLVYIVNLLYCSVFYGLGDLSRTIQSVPELMRSTLKVNILEFLILYICSKWIATVVCGLVVLLATLVTKHSFSGYAMGILFFLSQFIIRLLIPATSKFNIIRYVNVISMLKSTEFLGIYYSLNFFGTPVSIALVETVCGIIYLSVLSMLFCTFFGKVQLATSKKQYFVIPPKLRYNTDGSTSIMQQELFKCLLTNGGMVVLAIFMSYQAWQLVQVNNHIGVEESYYKYYMTNLSGAYTSAKYEWFIDAAENLSGVNTAEIDMNEALQTELKIFYRVLNKVQQAEKTPNAQLIYETGYEKLFGIEGNDDLIESLTCGLILSLLFAGFFAIEKETAMLRVIKSTALGRQHTVRVKMSISYSIASFVAIMSLVPRWFGIIRDYGLYMVFAPASNIAIYSHLPEAISLLSLLIFSVGLRIFACIIITTIVLLLSNKTGNTITAIFIALVIFCLPAILALSGLHNFKWIGIYSLFHFSATLAAPFGLLQAVALLLLSLTVYSAVRQNLRYTYTL